MDVSDTTVIAMVSEWPIRSAITLVLPLLFAIAQIINSYYHGVSFVYSGIFAVVFVGMGVLMAQQQCAEFRATRLRSAHTDEE